MRYFSVTEKYKINIFINEVFINFKHIFYSKAFLLQLTYLGTKKLASKIFHLFQLSLQQSYAFSSENRI